VKGSAIVYALFDLTPDEIALLEASPVGQYSEDAKAPPPVGRKPPGSIPVRPHPQRAR
jgi:hypothetical protein